MIFLRLAGMSLAAISVLAQAPAATQPTLSPSELRQRLHMASQLIQAGRLDQAQDTIDGMRGEGGPNPLIDGMEGFLQYRRHQYDQAVDVLQRALTSPSPPTWWRVLLAMSYYAQGKEERAQAELRTAQREDSKGYPEAYNSMMQAAILDTKNSPSVEGALTLNFLLLSTGNRRTALQSLGEQVKIFPKEPRLRVAQLGLLADSSNLKSAMEEAKKALAEVGEDATLHRMMGNLAARAQDYPEAILQLQKALELDPKYFAARLDLASVYQLQKKPTEAQKEFETVISAASVDPGVLALASAGLGSVLTDLKQWKQAESILQKSVEANPDNPPLLNNLAWLYAISEAPEVRNPKRAVELAEKAVSLSQQRNAAILDTLAEAYFAAGEAQKAVDTERKALSLAPGRADFKEHLARYQSGAEKKP